MGRFDLHPFILGLSGSLRPQMSLTFFVLQQQQNLGRRLGTSKMHLPPPKGITKAMVLLLLIC